MTLNRTEKRINKITSVLKSRQFDLRVVLENIHDPHNVSAIFRTCDAVGVPKVTLLYYIEKFPKIGKKSSASAFKWVEREKFVNVEQCYQTLRKEGFRIYCSSISDDADNIFRLDLTKKIAFVFGNEHRGVSDEAVKLSDKKFKIPMFGMVQSLNVSVSAAVVLYESLRQRIKKGFYDRNILNEKDLSIMIENWAKK